MSTKKDATIVATISFLAIVLIVNSPFFSSLYIFAKNYECHNYESNSLEDELNIQHGKVTCCSFPNSGGGQWCTDCPTDANNKIYDCGQRYWHVITRNNTTPTEGLLNGRIPATNTFNAPITTTGGNTSNPSNNNTSGSAAMKSARTVYSPTGGCIPGGSTCVPCDIGLARIGANCIPSGDWHPTNGLPPSLTLQQPPSTTTPPPSTGLLNKAPPPITSELNSQGADNNNNNNNAGNTENSGQQQQQQQQPPTTTCPDGSQPDANGNCPTGSSTTSHSPLSPLTNTKNQEGSNNNNNNNAGTNPIKHCSKTNAGGPHCPKAG